MRRMSLLHMQCYSWRGAVHTICAVVEAFVEAYDVNPNCN